MDRLPGERTRVSPGDAGAMPRIVAPNAQPAIEAAPGAARYRLIGLEIAQGEDVDYNYGLVALGGKQTTLEETPRDIILDRLYIHASPDTALKRGIALESASTVVANCYIADCHVEGQDAQAIGGFTGPGPFKIANNYLEGSGENLMFGGADPKFPGLVPSDIDIRGNHFYKPLSWRKQEPDFAGRAWTVKNLLELKNARRVWIEGNVLEHCWVHGQTGYAVVLTPRNQGGKAPWSCIEDVTFVNNIVRHCSSGVSILAEDDTHRSETFKRLAIRNNLIAEINPTRWGGDGRLFLLLTPNRPMEEIVIANNTALHSGRGNTFLSLSGKQATIADFVFRGNIVTRGQYGIHASGRGTGEEALKTQCARYDFAENLIIGPGETKAFPPDNAFAKTLDEAGFANPAAGDYRLPPGSPWSGRGADMQAIEKATAGAVSGIWP